MVGIPEEFTRTTVGREGDRGAEWLAELPSTVDHLLVRWECARSLVRSCTGVSGSLFPFVARRVPRW